MSETGIERPIDREAVVGYAVLVDDEKVGKVDKASITAAEGCLVVSRGRVLHKRVSLPLDVIRHVDGDTQTIEVSMSSDEFDHAPEWFDTSEDVYFDKPL
jgi:hypothetical protein